MAYEYDSDGEDTCQATPMNHDLNVISLLLKHGADPNTRDASGQTPLHVAAATNTNPAVVALLLNYGADTSLRDDADKFPVDLAEENEVLKGTDAFQRLHQPPHESALRDLDNLAEDE